MTMSRFRLMRSADDDPVLASLHLIRHHCTTRPRREFPDHECVIGDVGEHVELFTDGKVVESAAHHRQGGVTAVILGTVEIEGAGTPGPH
jgi:hypothetical protein